jgi:hypothetical protein
MIYILLCFISLFMGLGIQRCFKLKLMPALSLTLAPILSLSVCTILLGWLVKLAHPIKDYYLAGYVIVALFSLLGVTQENLRVMVNNFWLLILCILLPIALMFNYFWFGLVNYPGSTVADGWTYISVGQYLWTYPRGTIGNLIPLFQYASAFNSSRFITSAMLAFLSPLSQAGDTQLIANAYLVWIFFIFSCSCAFFALTQKIGKYIYPYLILTVFSGWFILLLKNNNFDHATFLGFLPVIAGGFVLFHNQQWVWCLLLSIIITAGLYIYPEMSLPLAFGTSLFFIAVMRKHQKLYIIAALLAASLTMLLLSPYLNEFIAFTMNQSHQLNLPLGSRSSAYFNPSMLIPSRMLQSFWGLRHNFLGHLTAIVATVLFARGLFIFYKEKRFALLIFIMALIAGAMIMIIKYQYSYGAFKFISISWWLISFAVIIGVKSILESHPTKSIKIILSLMMIAYVISGASSNYSVIKKPGLESLSRFRALQTIKPMIGESATLVNIKEDVANEWALYYLRNDKIKVVRPPRFMDSPSGTRFMNQAIYIDPASIKFIVTDDASSYPQNRLVWSNGLYYLWRIS